MDTATRLVTDYTSRDERFAKSPYAYPAYDDYCKHNAPDELTDADLLAPVLLNVQVKIRSFYDLQKARGRLQDGLKKIPRFVDLVDIEKREIEEMVSSLYKVLDCPDTKPWGVSVTTLSKILHRKRPESLVLHDKWVEKCYLGGNHGQFQAVKGRRKVDYMVALSLAIARDIKDQRELFDALAGSASCDLTHVRILDILAWMSKGETPS